MGVERFQWSWAPETDSYWDGPFKLIPLRDEDGNPKPAYYTYFMLQYFMNGFEKVEEVEAGGGVRLFRITLPGREVYVAWSEAGRVELNMTKYISGGVVVHSIVTEVDHSPNS